MAPTTSSRAYEDVLRLAETFADLPLEAVFKEDLLRCGIAFSDAALRYASDYKRKAYFIFSFDRVPIEAMTQSENLRVPEEIALVGGPHDLRRTIVSVRVNPASPYRVETAAEVRKDESQPDGLCLLLSGKTLCRVLLAPTPEFYGKTLRNDKWMSEVAPVIEWGYLIYLTVFRRCQYFGGEEECQFCDINENFRQQRNSGRPYQTVKSVEDVLEALDVIVECEDRVTGDTKTKSVAGVLPLLPTRAYTITGGSITSNLKGDSEVDFYCRYAEAIEQRFPGRWISKMVVQAHEAKEVRRFRDAGVQIYHPNYEVWDKRLFEHICPGKARTIGRDTWMRRILDAAEIMGPQNVIPNFVAGVEMARPHGFATVQEALDSTGEGLRFFMSHGVVPRFTSWCPEPLSVLGRDQGPAPLEYHLGLLRLWRDTHRHFRLPPPGGYGEPGPGQAVFSVSAFMDVLTPSES